MTDDFVSRCTRCNGCPLVYDYKEKKSSRVRHSIGGTFTLLVVLFFFISIIFVTIFPPPAVQPIVIASAKVIPNTLITDPKGSFLINAVTNATQTTTLVYITYSPSAGYQLSGMFTKSTLPSSLASLPIYKVSDIGPGPLKNQLDVLLKDIIWTP